ncbi:Terpene synthase [Apiospora kogelbergensis]|uniref:Terpene synthase n=1 Tax=Apiospora kogelbergensis TaxID=1337665 RepID=A0AAW0QY75_9PEZI
MSDDTIQPMVQPTARNAEVRTTQDAREHLVAQARGSRVKIPDLQSLMAHWPQGVHPEKDRLGQDVEDILQSTFPDPKDEARLSRLKASNFALFGASWWPYSSYEALKTAILLSIWMFIWDDETDSEQYSPLIHSFSNASAFREETVAYIQESLSEEEPRDGSTASSNPFITRFGPVGRSIVNWGDQGKAEADQTDRFLKELVFFVEMTEEEHKSQTTSCLPTVEEYMVGATIPKEAYHHEAMEVLWHETNVNISVTNDILSMKKEIAQSQVDSLVPLLFLRLGSLQAAVDHGGEMVKTSIRRIEEAEKDILAKYPEESKSRQALKGYIDGCKYACTANLNWGQV